VEQVRAGHRYQIIHAQRTNQRCLEKTAERNLPWISAHRVMGVGRRIIRTELSEEVCYGSHPGGGHDNPFAMLELPPKEGIA